MSKEKSFKRAIAFIWIGWLVASAAVGFMAGPLAGLAVFAGCAFFFGLATLMLLPR